ncbi:MAG: hypothetical protein RL299_820 [Pseudomonadota bacterium]|jgi:uncharacterized membrane protein YhhN
MPKHALIEQRPWLLLSLVAGISYFFVQNSQLPGLYLMAWKGAAVALLAVYAMVRHSGADSRQIAVVMAFGALGDVLIILQLEWGAISFLIGHLIAIHLYLRHRRAKLTLSQKAAAVCFLVLIPVISFLLPADRAAAPGVALYATGLGAMTAAAWTSTFSRYTVGIGAVMFAVSDLFIFAEIGPLKGSAIPDLLIWPLYYFGQFLICTGVIGELRRRDI